jgi:hypothetical protein
MLSWKALLFVAACALINQGPAEAQSNLAYEDGELENLLQSLDIDSKFAALSIVQSGMADVVQSVEVELGSSVEEASTSTILVFLAFKLRDPDAVNSANCHRVLASATRSILGGTWQKIVEGDGTSLTSVRESGTDVEGGLSNYFQLSDIRRRMLGYVGSRADVFDESSAEERMARLRHYIPAYNALEFEVHLTYLDDRSGAFTRERCNSRNIRG